MPGQIALTRAVLHQQKYFISRGLEVRGMGVDVCDDVTMAF